MEAHTAIGVQRQIGQALGRARVLVDDLRPFVAVEVGQQIVAAGVGEQRSHAAIVVQRGDRSRPLRAVFDLTHRRFALGGLGPPSGDVVRCRGVGEARHVGAQRRDLVGAENVAYV